MFINSETVEQIQKSTKLALRKIPVLAGSLGMLLKKNKTERYSIGKLIEQNARLYAGFPAIKFENRTISHKTFNEESNRYAHALSNAGIKKGDAVAVLMENRPEMLFCIVGIVKIGGIASLINTNQRKNVLTHSFKLCNPALYLIGEELTEAFQEIRGDLDFSKQQPVWHVADHGTESCPDGMLSAEAFLKTASTDNPSQLRDVCLGDPCFYIYTSGTTGLPKASIMSHLRWIKAASGLGGVCLELKPGDTMYAPLPLYHNTALTVAWGATTYAGAAIALRRKFSASHFWEDTIKFNAVAFCYIGELCRYLLNQAPQPHDSQNPVKKMVGNGLRPDIWKTFKNRFDIAEIYEFYGASEGNIAFANLLSLENTVGFCPAPYAIVEFDINTEEPVRDGKGYMRRVKWGGTGLLLGEVSERYAFDGYTDQSASEKKLFRNVFKKGDVWFNTGDLMKDQGFRHAQFVDRVGDTFRWKSENVSTTEVSEAINQFAGVQESTVYGVEIPGCVGRAGMVAVVLSVPMEAFDLKGFYQHLKSELPSYAIPVFLRFQKELEITGTFKHRKVELKKEGFDIHTVTDPLFVLFQKAKSYVAITEEEHAAIMSGSRSF
ncbi:MAG: long-chain-acyl-CoA synthetase [SAR324 cluster bacterium]|nr:long-chain-acyl-CoA synthetase [SAR324 cluster bacterium]